MKQEIKLSDHFSYAKILRFTAPSIGMMIFTSVYGVVDGFFVSNFVGKTPFAAVNFIYPLIMILSAIGFMFGAGGSALIAKTMGQGKPKEAQRQFSLFVYTTIVLGITVAALGVIFLRPIAVWLGAEGAMLEDCITYGRILMISLPFCMLQFEFQSLFITAEKPQIGLWVTVASGVTNMVLDALFMAVFSWGVFGAATATAISQIVGGVLPLIYFARPNTSRLRLGKTRIDGTALFKACTNGSSELMSNISMSVVSMLYNVQLLRYAGEDGIAAYGVLMYVNFVFLAIFIGYSVGIAPVISYHYGAENYPELKSLRKKSLIIIVWCSQVMLAMALLLAKPLSVMYVGYDPDLFELTMRAFFISAFSFLFSGIAIFGSSFFTALNDGVTSAIISFLRTLVFQMAAVLLFPLVWGIDGIWFSVVAAEMMAVAVTIAFLIGKRHQYHY